MKGTRASPSVERCRQRRAGGVIMGGTDYSAIGQRDEIRWVGYGRADGSNIRVEVVPLVHLRIR